MLRNTRTIAMIGASPNPRRDSYRVMRYMQLNGYRVIPVNPTIAGTLLLGETVASSLSAVTEPVDLVNVFRRPDAIPGIVDELLAFDSERRPRYLWLQIGVVHEEAAERARRAGVEVVMDRCIKIEFGRLLSHG